MKNYRVTANIMLLMAAIIWGFSFVVMKGLIGVFPVSYLLMMRFFVGALGLSFFIYKFRKVITKRTAFRGALLGFVLYLAFFVQTTGLRYTYVGENALITAVYVVLVPLMIWVVDKKRPTGRIFFAAIVCFAGIALLSLFNETNDVSLGSLELFGSVITGTSVRFFGDFLTLISGVLFALHIVMANKFSQKEEIMPLTCYQFAFAAFFALIVGLIFEPFPTAIPVETLLPLAYVCILSSLVALTFQNVGIKYADPSVASILLCSESLFGCLGGVVFMNDEFTVFTAIGSTLIIGSILISELKRKKKLL
ncbi:MAG: DMT family transporter [Clostridia bacterium]